PVAITPTSTPRIKSRFSNLPMSAPEHHLGGWWLVAGGWWQENTLLLPPPTTNHPPPTTNHPPPSSCCVGIPAYSHGGFCKDCQRRWNREWTHRPLPTSSADRLTHLPGAV